MENAEDRIFEADAGRICINLVLERRLKVLVGGLMVK